MLLSRTPLPPQGLPLNLRKTGFNVTIIGFKGKPLIFFVNWFHDVFNFFVVSRIFFAIKLETPHMVIFGQKTAYFGSMKPSHKKKNTKINTKSVKPPKFQKNWPSTNLKPPEVSQKLTNFSFTKRNRPSSIKTDTSENWRRQPSWIWRQVFFNLTR